MSRKASNEPRLERQNDNRMTWAQSLRHRLRLDRGSASTFGSEKSFDPPIGRHLKPGGEIGGYYIDFGFKTETPEWPPYWLAPFERQLHVATAQWGLGAYERFLDGDGEAWLGAAKEAADYLLEHQHRSGKQAGGWRHLFPMPHTYRIDPPWLSSITQGEGASLLTRIFLETGEERYAEGARLALKPMLVPVSEGGMLTEIDGMPFVEEYPTDPSSHVLNGAIFALWGFHDVGVGLADSDAASSFRELTQALAANLWRYDTGYWSRYDLYPHPVPNIASPAYHLLHVRQLEVLSRLASIPEPAAAGRRFDAYRASRRRRAQAVAHKIAFRVLVPRNSALAHRLPWNHRTRNGSPTGGADDAILLCYHAVSDDWTAALSVTPLQLEDHLRQLRDRGFRGVTFTEALRGDAHGKVVAITFDDGYRSVFALARPILERFGMPGTVFVTTDFLGEEQPMNWPGIDRWSGGEHQHELLPMSWTQARKLIDEGWEIGSHTKSHPRLTEISDEALESELRESRLECEQRLEAECHSLAFPYGNHDARVVAAAEAAGYSSLAALSEDNPVPSHMVRPRIGIYHADGHNGFRLKISPFVRRAHETLIWEPMVRIFRSLTGRKTE
jgi:heparosan-N-sulfate-glucuronate 5-epimerase